ncbi:MAG: serine/threonine protein kinase [Alkalispirochaeta sp.]
MEHTSFDLLNPEIILAAVESYLPVRLDGTIEPFPSYVNRVYGVRSLDDREMVVKFYRPGRWRYETILDEHTFLFDLAAAEIPVVAPIRDDEGDSLFEIEVDGAPEVEDGWNRGGSREVGDGPRVDTLGVPPEAPVFTFAIFPKRGGRGFDAEGDEEWFRLGALVGRIHQVGRRRSAPNRVVVDPRRWTGAYARELVAGGVVHPDLVAEFEDLIAEVTEQIAPLFADVSALRIHGDCHRGNILERPGEGLVMIDFDDMMTGPAVQDLWLLLPDHAGECTRELTHLIDGYSQFQELDRRELELIEPLRFMRMIHFLAWRARQRHDHWFQREFPEWGNHAFWVRELEDLKEQARYIV